MKPKLIHFVEDLRCGGLAEIIGELVVHLPMYSHSMINVVVPDDESYIDEEADLMLQSKGLDISHWVGDTDGPDNGIVISYDSPLVIGFDNKKIFAEYHRTGCYTYDAVTLPEMLPVAKYSRTVRTEKVLPGYAVGMFMGRTDYNEPLMEEFISTAPEQWKLFVSTLPEHSTDLIALLMDGINSKRLLPCRMRAGGIHEYLKSIDAVISIAKKDAPYTRCELETMAALTPLIRTETLDNAYEQLMRLRSDSATMRDLVDTNARIVKKYDTKFQIITIKEALKRIIE